MRDDFGWGYTGFVHVFGFVLYGIFALLSVAVAVAVIFFLIRFLIYGTKAAQLYIAKNTPAKPAAPLTEPATRGPVEPSSTVGPTTTPTGTATSTVAAPVDAPVAAPADPPVDTPVVPPAAAAPKAAPKATPPITPPATKKPPVKKTPQPPVA